MINLIDKRIPIDDLTIFVKLFKLHKSYLLLISDQEEMGIGNVTLASPSLIEGLKSTSVSYNLFGLDKKLLTTIISERVSNTLKAPVLLLLFLKVKKKEEEIAKPLINSLNKMLAEIIEQKD